MASKNSKTGKKYRFFVKDNVVFDIPSDVYCQRQVDNWRKSIIKTTEDIEQWVILCIPDISHTITQDAARKMKAELTTLSEYGCAGILILTSTVNAKIFAHALEGEDDGVNITGSESIEELCQVAQNLLGSQTILNVMGE